VISYNANDLSVGLAAEYIVCADLILLGYRAFLSPQNCPYDVVVDIGGRLLRIQVKSTRRKRPIPQRIAATDSYLFFTKRAGKGGKRHYKKNAFDLYAFVALDIRAVAYWPAKAMINHQIHLRAPGSKVSNGRRHQNMDHYTFKRAVQKL